MVEAVPEVAESEAPDKIKNVYEDVKATMRVPYVAPAVRRLASHPDYLISAWTALKPNAQTAYFEQQAEALRLACRDAVTAWTGAPGLDETAASVLQSLELAEPKYFLATAALRSATNGSRPLMQRVSLDEKRQVGRGIPEGAATVSVDEPDSADEQLGPLLQEAHALTRSRWTPIEFRALSSGPEQLQSVVRALQPLSAGPEYRRLLTRLRLRAEEAVGSLPFRMDISPHVLRQSGLSERDIDSVREILDSAYAIGASTLLHLAFLSSRISASRGHSEAPEGSRAV